VLHLSVFRSLSFDAGRSRGERRIKRGMAVNRRPLRPVQFQRTPPVARLPARDCPVWPQRERCKPHVDDARSALWSSASWVPTLRTVPLEESPAGRATRTVPTSECRRRPKGTDVRGSVSAPPAGSPYREAREAFTLEARAATIPLV
jgi:hypothetical protein